VKEPVHHSQPNQLASNREVILWAYILLGMLAAMVYLSGLDLAGFRYRSMHAGVSGIFVALPALAPYFISAIISMLLVGTHHQIRVWFFLSIVPVATILGALLFNGIIDFYASSSDLSLATQVILAQTVFLSASAVLIFWK